MKKLLLLFILISIFQFGLSQQINYHKSILKIADEIEKFNNKEFPRDSIIENVLGDFEEEDFLRRFNFNKVIFQKLKNIPNEKLNFDDHINLELLKHEVKNRLSFYEFKEYLNPILSDDGFHIDFASLATENYLTKKSLEIYLKKLKAFPKYTKQHLNLIRKGLALGISAPEVALKGYESTYNQHIVTDIEKSIFWKPFQIKPITVEENDWQKIIIEGRNSIETAIIPSFNSIKTFFENEYFPKTRKTLSASNFPNGKAFYEDRVKFFTTTDLSPNEVFEIGVLEVARIKIEMIEVMKEAGFNGSIKDFIQILRTDPKFYPKTADELMKEAAFIAKKIDGKLPLLFGYKSSLASLMVWCLYPSIWHLLIRLVDIQVPI